MTTAQNVQKDFEQSFGTGCFIAWFVATLFCESERLLAHLPSAILGAALFVALLALCARCADALDAIGPARLSFAACLASMLGVAALEVAKAPFFFLIGGVLIAFGAALFLMVFGKNLAFSCHEKRLPQLCSAFLTATLLIALVSMLNDAAQLVVIFLMPLLCALHLSTLKSNARVRSFANLSESRNSYRILASTLYTTGITGFVWGIAFYLVTTASSESAIPSLSFALPVACGAVLGLADSLQSHHMSEKSLLRLFATLAFVGLAPLPYVPEEYLFLLGGYLFFAFSLDTIMCISAMGEVAYFNQLSPYWVYGKSLACYFAGAALGLFVYAITFGSESGPAIQLCVTWVVLLIIVGSHSFVFQDRYPADEGLIDIEEARKLAANESRPALWQSKIDAVVQEYDLTTRQQEVFRMLVRGRNASYIAETFVISISTAKAHIHNIYRKLDIHSQQELINLVENASPKKD